MLSLWERLELLRADVVIVGGGVVGLWTALECCRRYPQRSTLVLERSTIPCGASTRNAGFATIGTVGEATAHAELVGDAAVVGLMVERWLGLQQWRREFGDASLGFEAVGGYELVFEGEEHLRGAVERWNELLREAFGGTVFHDRPELLAQWRWRPEGLRSIIANPYDGALNTGKALKALQQRALQAGATIWTGAKVELIEPDSEGIVVRLWDAGVQRQLELRAKAVAVCANAWIPQLVPEVADIQPARGQVLLTVPVQNPPFPTGTYHFCQGYYYFRWVGQRLLFGGGRHLALQEETTYELGLNPVLQQHLESLLKTRLLGRRVDIENRWSGVMGMRPEKLPRVERVGERIVVGFGCNGMGLALAPRIAEQVAGLVGACLVDG
ncbi:MAG: FAD-dependent oxidoreductase [Chlorobiota bacterium]